MLFLLLGQGFDLAYIIAVVIVLFFAFAYHEFGHAIVADRLGDMTPRNHGRITLNPIPHVSLVGLIMVMLIGFGGAYTPINPNALRGNPRTSHVYVALAGPVMNFVMAILFAIPLRLLTMGVIDPTILAQGGTSGQWIRWLFDLFDIGVRLNLFLIALNLLPIPPLDGFWVLRGVVPLEMAVRLDVLRQYGMMVFLLILILLPRISPSLDIFPLINDFSSTVYRFLVGSF